MKILGFALAALTVFSAPATAQVTGFVNRTAQKVEQSIDLGSEGVITLNYTAITFAAGKWATPLADEGKRKAARTRLNGLADKSPIGFFETTSDVMIGDVRIAAGEYDVSFRLNADYKWELGLKSGDKLTSIALNLMPSGMDSKRLIVSLHAGEADGTASVYIAFGEEMGSLELNPAPAKKEASGER